MQVMEDVYKEGLRQLRRACNVNTAKTRCQKSLALQQGEQRKILRQF
jgi:hypothetical protein